MSYITFSMNAARILAGKLFPPLRRSFTSRQVLEKNFPAGSDFFFIQVGAADGISHDYLFDFVKVRKAGGIVIEPVLSLFQELVSNYAFNSLITPVNLAVHASSKEVEMYTVDEARLHEVPTWARGISSFDPNHHKKSEIESHLIEKIIVPADHLMNIISNNYGFSKIDLLQIDAEGSDFAILNQFDFTLIRPKIIRFEYVNLNKNELKKSIQLLRKLGYYCFDDDFDMIGVDLRRVRI